jgi:hypothetical protein
MSQGLTRVVEGKTPRVRDTEGVRGWINLHPSYLSLKRNGLLPARFMPFPFSPSDAYDRSCEQLPTPPHAVRHHICIT